MGLFNRIKDPVEGTAEVGGAVIASTLTTVAVFLPIVFVEGIAGLLFGDMALTVTLSPTDKLVEETAAGGDAGDTLDRAMAAADERDRDRLEQAE